MADVGRLSARHANHVLSRSFGLSACRPARQGGDLVSEACRPGVGPVFASKLEKSRWFPLLLQLFACLQSLLFSLASPPQPLQPESPPSYSNRLFLGAQAMASIDAAQLTLPASQETLLAVVSLESWGSRWRHGRNCSGQTLPTGPPGRCRLLFCPGKTHHSSFCHTRIDNFYNSAKTIKQNYLGST